MIIAVAREIFNVSNKKKWIRRKSLLYRHFMYINELGVTTNINNILYEFYIGPIINNLCF